MPSDSTARPRVRRQRIRDGAGAAPAGGRQLPRDGARPRYERGPGADRRDSACPRQMPELLRHPKRGAQPVGWLGRSYRHRGPRYPHPLLVRDCDLFDRTHTHRGTQIPRCRGSRATRDSDRPGGANPVPAAASGRTLKAEIPLRARTTRRRPHQRNENLTSEATRWKP
jgi:hypothetical protein